MPRFEPFPGLRYAVDDLAEVTAPPYDVIDAAERAALVARHEGQNTENYRSSYDIRAHMKEITRK